jgi:hypothetical protein
MFSIAENMFGKHMVLVVVIKFIRAVKSIFSPIFGIDRV